MLLCILVLSCALWMLNKMAHNLRSSAKFLLDLCSGNVAQAMLKKSAYGRKLSAVSSAVRRMSYRLKRAVSKAHVARDSMVDTSSAAAASEADGQPAAM